jgi:serine/threonine protein kinase
VITDRFGIVGTVIASAYQVESVVAEGGFGVVYRARHGGFRAPVALKCLKVPQHVAPEHQARFLEQFRAEAELMFRLSASTSTVTRPLHVDVMTTPNGSFVPFMVLEWLEGDTLDAVIRARDAAGERPFTLAELIALLEPVARALDMAHHFNGPRGAETIAHCDLKPENVFIANVNGERVAKILDFGVANVRSAATAAAKAGAPPLALFTPAYGAPEQWNPKVLGETGPWTDVWGLALTLVEALVGRPVITGDHLTVRQRILDPVRRPTPRHHGIAVSDRVEKVLARALAVDPRERFQDARAFWNALVEAAAGPTEQAPSSSGPLIPDLVPLTRTPSHPDLDAMNGPASFDFEEADGGRGVALALDLPPEETRPRRTTSSGGLRAMMQPTAHADAPAPPEGPASLPRPGAAPSPMPSLAPLSPRAAGRALEPPAAPAAGSSSAPPVVRTTASTKPSVEPTLARKLAPGLAVAGSSIVLTLLDRAYAAATGEVFSLGPVRTSSIAALLLLGGLALAGRELLARR